MSLSLDLLQQIGAFVLLILSAYNLLKFNATNHLDSKMQKRFKRVLYEILGLLFASYYVLVLKFEGLAKESYIKLAIGSMIFSIILILLIMFLNRDKAKINKSKYTWVRVQYNKLKKYTLFTIILNLLVFLVILISISTYFCESYTEIFEIDISNGIGILTHGFEGYTDIQIQSIHNHRYLYIYSMSLVYVLLRFFAQPSIRAVLSKIPVRKYTVMLTNGELRDQLEFVNRDTKYMAFYDTKRKCDFIASESKIAYIEVSIEQKKIIMDFAVKPLSEIS